MSYCLNPSCQKPENPEGATSCLSCGSKLLLGDRYRAIHTIGRGGFGRTLLGVDGYKPSKPPCVIKQFSPQAQGTNNSDKAAQLFEQEAVRLEELGHHPQIPELLAYFTQEERQYLVQEFIDGRNLAQEMELKGRFSEREILHLLVDLLPVLHFVHSRKVIHRDIKPANIIHRGDGQLVLVDFGAAKSIMGTNASNLGTVIGTAGFVAPEQAVGKAIFASDIFSLGVTSIHLLTGVDPFELYDVSAGDWIWREYLGNNTIDDTLGRVLDKMLENASKRRYQSAEEVLKDLNVTLPQEATTPSPPQESSQNRQQSSSQTLSGLSGVKSSTTKATSATQSTGLPPRETRGINGAQVISPRASNLPPPPPRASSLPPPPPPRASSLPQLPKSPTQAWKCVHTLTGHSDSVRSVVFSPDGKILVSGSDDGTIKVWNPLSSELKATLTGHSNSVLTVAYSPDGRILASGSKENTIKLWNASNGKLIHTLTGHSDWVHCVAFSPDGQIIASGSSDKTIKLWERGIGQLKGTIEGHSNWVYCLAYSPNGGILASGSLDNSIKLWESDTARLINTLTGHFESVNAVAFSPDGETIASGSGDKTIKLWEAGTGQLKSTLTGHTSPVNTIAYSPNKLVLASGSGDRYNILDSGSEDNVINLWQLSAGKVKITLTEHESSINAVVFGPNGQMLASASEDNTIKIWRYC